MRADNAVIMAAGTSSRFAPLSYEKPKGLVEVRGEILIERQIKQLLEAGIRDIYIITGYKAKAFKYLTEKFGVYLRYNPYYDLRNNNASIKTVEDILGNTYVCSADNYFTENPFEREAECAFYAAVYSDGPTDEWCLKTDPEGFINHVTIGGCDAWYMLGHTFWDKTFSDTFTKILDQIYDLPETAGKLWESIYMEHLDVLHMKMRKYPEGFIYEFDTLDELRQFDTSYVSDTRSAILKKIAFTLEIPESEITNITAFRTGNNEAAGFTFRAQKKTYTYYYGSGIIQ